MTEKKSPQHPLAPCLLTMNGTHWRCGLSSILFSVFIDDLLREVEKADLGIQLEGGKKVGGMLFADDFVGVSGSKEGLQKLALLEKCMGIIICMCTIYGPSQ